MRFKRMTRSEKQEQTRALLLEAGNSKIAQRGFGAITIEEITQLSGLTRGAFYSNFSSKNELFIHLLRRKLGETSQLLQRMDESEKRTHCFPSPSSPDSLDLWCDAESAIVWIEAMLHAWRDPTFLDSFATPFLSRGAESEVLRDRNKNHARVEVVALAREIATAVSSLRGSALHLTIDFSANLDSKQGDGKLSMLFTLPLSKEDTYRK
ncbi:TetR/AcrR family transcriptional regulator [Herbaspirillum sp. RV1423]|uniref:TetR/AcrR family transcriptional regulator n=1 Tax=Herbaspirillum sp. RV1423 TaxID=1443993 RepID=UPI0006870D43|nr:TetR family transcriptional regulator [Herbaspirillum sp. RV1423]